MSLMEPGFHEVEPESVEQEAPALAVLLTAAPPHPAVDTAIRFALAAVEEGLNAAVFMMDDGVHAAPYLAQALRSGLGIGASASGDQAEAGQGARAPVRLVRCSQDARAHGAAGAEGVIEGSQADWARMVAAAKVVLRLG